MRFAFPHSHAFPRGRVAVADDGADPAATVEFADGVTVIGTWRREGAEFVLDVPAHRTARGTAIAARRWRVREGADGTWRTDPA